MGIKPMLHEPEFRVCAFADTGLPAAEPVRFLFGLEPYAKVRERAKERSVKLPDELTGPRLSGKRRQSRCTRL